MIMEGFYEWKEDISLQFLQYSIFYNKTDKKAFPTQT